ncbi:MAG: hypothetical protein IKX98_05675 [Clostridia bacterium]|nr:hypothetical protein [Clostridia bacterium]
MIIEYYKIKSFGNVDNLRLEPGDVSAFAGKGELGLATLTAFQLFIFYGSKECAAEVQPYLDSAKGPVAGGYAVLSDGDRRYVVAREYLNGEERLLVKDADTDIEMQIPTSAGEFFFSRTAKEYMHGSEGAPVDISDILKTAPIRMDSTAKIKANEILALRERLDALGKKQMRLGAESMAARGVNPAERLRKAREVQDELLENEERLKELAGSGEKPTAMKKKTLVLLLCAGGFLFVAGLLLFLLMSYINIEKSKAFFISLGLMGAGAAVLLWLLFFKLIEKIVMKNVPNTEEALRARREELSEKLDILLEGSDFEQLERQAKQSVSTARSAAEIDRDLEAVNKEMEEIRTKLNKELTE